MALATAIRPKNGGAVVMVGTVKGAFLLSADASRKQWQVSGPHFPGHVVYSFAYDGRAGRRRIWAGSMHWAFGTNLYSSDDFGKNWTQPKTALVKFPEDAGLSLKQIWQIMPGRAEEPDTMYCGVEPASLFESHDNGESWSLVRGLHDHPHRPKWNPGNGGLCMHTVLPDPSNPKRMHIAISAAGVYRTDDGGKSWQVRNKGITAEFLPDKYPEFGQCVHKIDRHPSRPERLFLQNHGGLFRSDNAGDSWQYIGDGVPSDFGFPMVVHPHDPDSAYIFPLSREMRCGPDGKVRVYKTTNGGGSWKALTGGLPQQSTYETVLRDGMAADSLDPAGIYFGTRSGKIYGSNNEGTSWKVLVEGLPPVTCVKTAVIGEPRSERRARPSNHAAQTSPRSKSTTATRKAKRSAKRK